MNPKRSFSARIFLLAAAVIVGVLIVFFVAWQGQTRQRELAAQESLPARVLENSRQQRQFAWECAEMRLDSSKLKRNLVGKSFDKFAPEIGLKPYEPDGHNDITSPGWRMMELNQKIWLIRTSVDMITGEQFVVYVSGPLEPATTP